jgi:hypothetical protein
MVAALAGTVLLWTRLLELDVSFWHDEVFTVLNYSSRGPDAIFFGESEPNNHVLYSLLSWATTRLLGDSEEAYRLSSVVPAIAAVAALGWWSWRRLGVPTALVFAILAVTSRVHLDLSTQARGYGLAFLAAALMLIAADRLNLTGSSRALGAFAGAGLVGICTLYVFVLAFAGQALALLSKPALRRGVAAASAVVALAALVFYSPLFDDFAERRPRGQELGSRAFTQPLEDLAAPSLQLLFSTGSRPALFAAVAAAFAAVGTVAVWLRAGRGLAFALFVPPLFTYLIVGAAGIAVQPRYGSYLLFHVLLLIAAGVAELGGWLARPRALRPVTILVGVLLAFFASSRILDASAGRQELPLENFKDVAQVVDGIGIDRVVTDSARPEGLRYYIGDDRLRVLSPRRVERLVCTGSGPLVYVRQDFLLESHGRPADVGCLERRGATRVRIEQRGYGDFIDVWMIPVARAGPGPGATEGADRSGRRSRP